ncbi:MAG: hypothetical protein ACRYG4_25305 [Janthinobacterium lividum]
MTDAELFAANQVDPSHLQLTTGTIAAAQITVGDAKIVDDRARDFRIVAFRETDYRTGCVTSRDVEAPVINRFSDHVLVRLPDGSSLRVQEKRR